MSFLRRAGRPAAGAVSGAVSGADRPHIVVRPATAADARTIAVLARGLSLSDGGRASQLTEDACLRDCFGEAAAFRAVIAETAGQPVGYAAYYWGYDTDTATKGVYVSDLFVQDEWRRCGAGRALMAAIAATSREMGGRWMFWSVLRHNRGGRRFYRRIARELDDVVVVAAYGPPYDALAELGGATGSR